MKAWVQTAFGGPEARRLMDVETPHPAADEVLVQVAGCALNRLDLLQRRAPVVQPFSLPHIAGMDLSGRVIQAGGPAGEHLLHMPVVIDPVVSCGRCDMCVARMPMYCRVLRTIGSTRNGGLAQYVAVPIRNCIAVAASGADLADMACIPVAAVTAWHALITAGHMKAGETVMIPAAGSGLGSAGIPMARQAGCRVITTVGSAAKVAKAAALGADLVIDRTREDWVEKVRTFTDDKGADLVWDHVGGAFLQQAIDACSIGGRVVLSGTTAAAESTIRNTSLFHWGRSLIGHGGYSREEMRLVVDTYVQGALKATIDSRWDFAEVPAAESRLESDMFFGKVLVCVAPAQA